jgi:DNA repair exonuclease SbcCD ATPase subunit
MKPITVLTCLLAAALALPAQAEQSGVRMYKCVDAAGKVYYSDKLNPDCGQNAELNRQGVVMKKKEIAKPTQSPNQSPNEVVAMVKNTREQDRRDRALMATYTSEEEIDAARDRSLALPVQGTKTIESKLDKANQQLSALKERAETLATQKKPLPAHLLEDVNVSQMQVSGLETELAQRKAQSDAIRARFEADKQRFRELKNPGPQ